jgi:hypothetical protein
MVFRVAQRDRGAHRSPVALGQLDVDQADAAAAFAHGGDHPHRSGVRRPQEVPRNRDRMDIIPVFRAGRVRAQRQHRAAVHLGPDGPMFVQLTVIHAVTGRGQRHRVGEQG